MVLKRHGHGVKSAWPWEGCGRLLRNLVALSLCGRGDPGRLTRPGAEVRGRGAREGGRTHYSVCGECGCDRCECGCDRREMWVRPPRLRAEGMELTQGRSSRRRKARPGQVRQGKVLHPPSCTRRACPWVGGWQTLGKRHRPHQASSRARAAQLKARACLAVGGIGAAVHTLSTLWPPAAAVSGGLAPRRRGDQRCDQRSRTLHLM